MAATKRPIALRDVQRLMGAAIFRPLSSGYAMQKIWTDGRPTAEVADLVIKPNDRLTSFERLEIYNKQYWFRLIDALHEDFPGLRAVIGRAKFQRLVIDYLAAHPSKSFTLRNLGHAMVTFLSEHPKLSAPHAVAAIDIAKLEWAQVIAFDEGEKPAFSAEDLVNKSADKLRLGLQPYLSILQLSYAMDDYLIAVKKILANVRPDDDAPAIRMRPKKKPTYLAVHRHDLGVYYKPLEPGAYHLLSALSSGQTLAQALAALSEKLPAEHMPAAPAIQQWFASWTRMGWFCRP
jgi:hypothetical protein